MRMMLIMLIASAATAGTNVKEILKKVDQLYREDSSVTKMEMKIETPHWKRTLRMNLWTKGTKKTFVRITYPKKDSGIATLRRGNDMWNYFPKINKVIKVPASMRMGSWMGSDFTNDDLVKETTLFDDFTSTLVKGEDKNLFTIESKPLKDTATIWGKVITTIRKNDYLPVMQFFYNERGELSRTWKFKDIRVLGGKKMPTTIELISHVKKGNKTIVKYLSADFSKKISDKIFTRKNLQKRK